MRLYEGQDRFDIIYGQADQGGKQEHPCAGMYVETHRHSCGRYEIDQHILKPQSQWQPDKRCQGRQKQAFKNRLAAQTTRTGAQGSADAELRLPGCGTSQ